MKTFASRVAPVLLREIRDKECEEYAGENSSSESGASWYRKFPEGTIGDPQVGAVKCIPPSIIYFKAIANETFVSNRKAGLQALCTSTKGYTETCHEEYQ